jgi:hypothetical protein
VIIVVFCYMFANDYQLGEGANIAVIYVFMVLMILIILIGFARILV